MEQVGNQFTLAPQYPGPQHFSKLFDLFSGGTWQGTEICGIIRKLAVNCTPVLVCSNDNGYCAADTASHKILMGAVQALCDGSPLDSQQNHSDPSLNTLENAFKQCIWKHGGFRETIVLKSTIFEVDN